MSQLFSESLKRRRPPLAERMRPRRLEEFVGQEELVGPGKPLRKMLEQNEIRSLVLWGPPGTGKTTLGWIIARSCGADFIAFSATRSSIKEIQQAMERSKKKFLSYGARDLIFVDELHRFNKAQQAAFLPYVEEGSIILIGATTENPSFEIITPLLSRSQVFVLHPLSTEHIKIILKRALIDRERGLGARNLELAPDAEEFIAQGSVENLSFTPEKPATQVAVSAEGSVLKHAPTARLSGLASAKTDA